MLDGAVRFWEPLGQTKGMQIHQRETLSHQRTLPPWSLFIISSINGTTVQLSSPKGPHIWARALLTSAAKATELSSRARATCTKTKQGQPMLLPQPVTVQPASPVAQQVVIYCSWRLKLSSCTLVQFRFLLRVTVARNLGFSCSELQKSVLWIQEIQLKTPSIFAWKRVQHGGSQTGCGISYR